MLAETRRRHLLDLIAQRGFATLTELVDALNVSESTVRRDLEALDLAGSIKRTHGGAVCADEGRTMPAFDERTARAIAEKRAIGRATAALLEDGETVLLDGGTTTLEVARALVGRPVQVVTNSLPIAQLLATGKEADLILIGGYVYPRTGVALGPLAIATMQGIRVRKAILGAGGITADGVYNSNLLLVETERQMMECGQEVIIVADHSKFGWLSLCWLCGLDDIDRVVVDPALPDDYRGLLEAADVEVHIAPLATESLVSSSDSHDPAPFRVRERDRASSTRSES
ncbi:MAG TPA: DeoR/GlpR family DNA-binding transcription regulator [Isosphaeraceae bacterium]|nr:DeoR/GlpR family DNA-binding transcription regulator [Isosphaeraceae bacterium]